MLYEEYSKAQDGVGKSFFGLKRDEILPINGTSARISQCNISWSKSSFTCLSADLR